MKDKHLVSTFLFPNQDGEPSVFSGGVFEYPNSDETADHIYRRLKRPSEGKVSSAGNQGGQDLKAALRTPVDG